MDLFSNSINLLGQALNYSSLKQKVVAQNIANVDTPNYKAQDVSFQSLLDNAMNQNQGFQTLRTDPRQIDFSENSTEQSAIVTRPNAQYNSNGNSVDVDQEMSDMASNQIFYNGLVEQLNGKFSSLQYVINGGK